MDRGFYDREENWGRFHGEGERVGEEVTILCPLCLAPFRQMYCGFQWFYKSYYGLSFLLWQDLGSPRISSPAGMARQKPQDPG